MSIRHTCAIAAEASTFLLFICYFSALQFLLQGPNLNLAKHLS
jgi:hypothetical protein